MNRNINILITGAAGFIGSSLVTELNKNGFDHLILADNFDKSGKDRYLKGKHFLTKINFSNLFSFLQESETSPRFVFHLGGRTSGRPEQVKQNLLFPQRLFNWCSRWNVPFVYASSSSTYGKGEFGYSDASETLPLLEPLNDYGKSKHRFDVWISGQEKSAPWTGLKIFNVYGSNEYHKGRSASVAFKSYFEIRKTGRVVLFGSSGSEYPAGEQQRDFIYIKDVTRIFYWFLDRWIQEQDEYFSGIYNVGTGAGRSFNDVVRVLFRSMNLPEEIQYKPIPEDIRPYYAGCAVAEISKLRSSGYQSQMWALEEGIEDLVKNYFNAGCVL